jgi:hypothetical protein
LDGNDWGNAVEQNSHSSNAKNRVIASSSGCAASLA